MSNITENTFAVLEDFMADRISSQDIVYMEERGLVDSELVQAFLEGKLAFDWNSVDDFKLSSGNDMVKQLLNNYVEKASKLVYAVKADPNNSADIKKAQDFNKEIAGIESSTKLSKQS